MQRPPDSFALTARSRAAGPTRLWADRIGRGSQWTVSKLLTLSVLALAACGGDALEGGAPAAAPTPGEALRDARLAALELELAEERALREGLQGELVELRSELNHVQTLRVERELEWIAFNQTVDAFDLPSELLFRAQGIEPYTVEEAPPGEEEARLAEELRLEREASAERLGRLRGLLRSESVAGFDPLEVGRLDGRGTGPVVFRLLDDRGRLAGSLAAEHLHIEGSLSGRTVTIVLEDGYESHAGQRVPFANGVRRILLPRVDPSGWIETVPELFAIDGSGGRLDDGLWDVGRVKRAVNLLLERDAGDDVWVLRHVVGVNDGSLTQVHLTQYLPDGEVRRHVFADRLRLAERPSGVELVLEDGVTLRGDAKTAFLNGVYRVRLPHADPADWRRQDLPGLRLRAPGDPEPAAGGGALADPEPDASASDPPAAGTEGAASVLDLADPGQP